eukprot:3879008-Pleurochrysis_carterae.AAC.1
MMRAHSSNPSITHAPKTIHRLRTCTLCGACSAMRACKRLVCMHAPNVGLRSPRLEGCIERLKNKCMHTILVCPVHLRLPCARACGTP